MTTKIIKRRRKTNPLFLNFRRLAIFGVFLSLPAASLYVWHSFADAETQRKIELFTLNVIDTVRENNRAPDELVFWLDLAADKLPLLQGTIVQPGAKIDTGGLILGEMPVSRRTLTVLKNTGYIVGYDEERGNPAWVAYKVFPKKFPDSPRPEKFDTDTRTRARVNSDDYTNSGFTRGHMAPNRAIALCYGADAQRETFLMSNIAPQDNTLNFGFWSMLERRIMDRYTRRFGEIWVFCGPVYELGVGETKIGNTAVPNEFFLIIADQTDSGGIRAESFLVPNDSSVASRAPEDFLSSIGAIETKTGLNFFSNFTDEAQKTLENSVAERVW